MCLTSICFQGASAPRLCLRGCLEVSGHADVHVVLRLTPMSGLLHPLIHLGFGLEFDQPAIVAEALAQTAVHEDWIGRLYLLPVEKAAGGIGKPGKKTMLQILNEIRADKKLAGSVKWEDGNKIRDGVLKRAPDEMIKYAAQVSVSAEQMEEKLAELLNLVGKYRCPQEFIPASMMSFQMQDG